MARDAGVTGVAVTLHARVFVVHLRGVVCMAGCKTVCDCFLLRIGVACSTVFVPLAIVNAAVYREKLRVVIYVPARQSGGVTAVTRIALPGITRHAYMDRIDHRLAVVVARETREECAIDRIGVTGGTVCPHAGMAA